MRFRKYQRQARLISGHLLWLYALAVLAVAGLAAAAAALMGSLYLSADKGYTGFAVNRTVFAAVFASVVGAVAVAGAVRLRQLSAGGHVVAQALGGRRISRENADFAERRFLNVVEEMALASGVRMPKVYVLPDAALNAFAAGMGQKDAVIGITRGALQAFDRNELQAVAAHEFSHILNGDMRRNMQLCGCLYGLQMISALGRLFVCGDTSGSLREEGGRRLPTLFFGMVLLCIGFTGSLAAGWIQAAISRQREFLADASAVQFTRQSEGLASALYKVAVAPQRRLNSPYAAEYAHFMFDGVHEADIFDKLAATHPDILLRIERLNPLKARLWQREIRRAQAVKHTFFYIPQTAGFSDGLHDAPPAAEACGMKRAEELAGNIRRLCPQAAQRQAELVRCAPRHWLSAEGDGERLLVVLAVLFDAEAAELVAAEWETQMPLRAAFYRRLRRQPLPAPLHRALLEFLLPTLAALPESGQAELQSGLNRLLANRTLPAPNAFLWLLAAAWTDAFRRPEAETAAVFADERRVLHVAAQWQAAQGRLNGEARRNWLKALNTLASLPYGARVRIVEQARTAANGGRQAEEAVEILHICGQAAAGRQSGRAAFAPAAVCRRRTL